MAGKPSFRKPAPEGVVEQVGIGTGSSNGMVELDNGSLMMIAGSRCQRRYAIAYTLLSEIGCGPPLHTD